METKPEPIPGEKLEIIKQYLKERLEKKVLLRYIKRDALKKFDLTPEQWEANFKHSALEEATEMIKENQEEEAKKMLGLGGQLNAETIEIRKAKITGGDTLEVEYHINGNAITIKSKKKVHVDLKKAFEELVPHFAMLCDLKEVKKLAVIYTDVQIHGLHNLRVSCISMGGGEPATGVILTGIKQINNNKQIVINSPFTEFDDENEPYPFSGLLCKSINKCKDEVIAYLNGKVEVDPQTSMEEVDGFNLPVKPKKEGKVVQLQETPGQD